MFNFTNWKNIPVLPKRENNSQKFYTCLILTIRKGSSSLQWKSQPNLQRNIKLYEEMDDKFRDLCSQQDRGNGVAQFWREVVLNQQTTVSWEPTNKTQLAWEHLASFFEEKCYWTAKDLCKDCNLETWQEFLCLARLLIYNPLKLRDVLVCYNPAKTNIDSYVSEALTNYIKSETYQNKFSRWRLLYSKSDKELKEALQSFGRNEPEISQFIFARKYFKQIYLMSKVKNPARKVGQKWLNPDAEDFEQSAQCYNIEKLSKSAPYEVSVNSTHVTGIVIQEWMEVCVQALEQYPKSILPAFSLEALQSIGFEAKSKPILTIQELEYQNLSVIEDTSEEEFYLSEKVNSVLSQNLMTLKPDAQKILFLYYGFDFNQKQLADLLNINQSSISRCIAKSTLSLLNKILEIAQPQLWTYEYVKRWLKKSYQSPSHSDIIQASLVSAVKQLSVEEREFLQLRCNQQVDTKLDTIVCKLQDNLILDINNWIKKYTEKWLTKYYKSLTISILKTASYPRDQNLEAQTIISLVEAYLQSLKLITIK